MTSRRAVIKNYATGSLSITHIRPHSIAHDQLLVKVEAVALNVRESRFAFLPDIPLTIT